MIPKRLDWPTTRLMLLFCPMQGRDTNQNTKDTESVKKVGARHFHVGRHLTIGRTCLSVLAFSVFVSGCQSPLWTGPAITPLQQTVEQAIAQELRSLAPPDDPEAADLDRVTVRPESPVLEQLAPRLEELEAIGPLGRGSQPRMNLGPDLTGREQDRVGITLQDAINAAVNRNLGIRASRLQPAISAADVIIAEAVFDTALFANFDFQKIDEPQRVPVINNIPLGTPFSASKSYRFETGLRRRLPTGTDVFVSTDLTRFHNRAPGITFMPDPGYTSTVRLGVTQALLRGFGADVNTADIRISRNEAERSLQQLRADLLQIIADTEFAYWDLAFAWSDLAVAEWLLEVGQGVRDVLQQRLEFDVTMAEYSDAVARVEQRRADVIRAQRQVRAASDRLKLLINDPLVSVTSEATLYPLDQPADTPVAYNLREAMLTAIDHRPEVEQAALTIDNASILQRVAANDRLPILGVSAQMAFVGLDDSIGDAYRETARRDFIDYLVSLAFEYPLGNRAADAAYRQARLQRSAAVLDYRRTVQNVIQEVKTALRDLVANYDLILATRAFRVAQAENLRTLLVEEEMLVGLTPEFLNLKFQRQETLAQAKRQEVQALVNFGQSLAALYRAMGTGIRMWNIEIEIVDDPDLVDPLNGTGQ